MGSYEDGYEMGSYGCKKKRKEIVRYLGILGISIYSCEVHGMCQVIFAFGFDCCLIYTRLQKQIFRFI